MTMKIGAYVTSLCGAVGDMTGEIVGIHSESKLTGNFYIIRILYRNLNVDISDEDVPNEKETWEKYPYDYVVLCEKVLSTTSEGTLATLRSMGIVPDKVSCLGTYTEMQNEKKLRSAVKNLKIDETHLKNFLEKAAKEYMRALHIKGKIHNVYPLDFIVRFTAPTGYGGFQHIRVPIADFFEGKSSVTRMKLEMRKTIKELTDKIGSKISEVPNVSKFVVNREMLEQDKVQKTKKTPTKSKRKSTKKKQQK